MSQSKSKNPYKTLAAGAAAGGIEAMINYPTEFVKTQLQLQQKAVKGGPPAKFSGPWNVVTKTVSEKGVLGLYKGLSSLVVGTMFKSAVRFGSYEKYAKLLQDDNGKLSAGRTAVAGLLTGTTEAFIAVTPTETIKTKLIDDTNRAIPRYKGMVHGVSTIVKEEGITGIYKGLSATVMRQAMNSGVRFTIYGSIKQEILERRSDGKNIKKDLSVLESLGAGIIAGTVNVYVTMPLDVIKTRMQGLGAAQYKGVVDCFSQVVRTEGVLALWRGSLPRLARVGPSGGIMFVSYEQALKVLDMIVDDW